MRSKTRLSITIDTETYGQLQAMAQRHGFAGAGEMVGALVRVLLDRLDEAGRCRYDLSYDDWKYIDGMFDEMSQAQGTPYGIAPMRRRKKRID